MRVVVVGVSGAGKSTFAARLAAATGMAHLELDQINWRPGWHDRSNRERDAFIIDVDHATRGERWAIAGSYHSKVGALLWSRATHAVWLDLPKPLVMRQVISRSLARAWDGKDVFPGCKENWTRLFSSTHPIRWAWDNYGKRRALYEGVTSDPAYAHVTLFRCRSRKDTARAFTALASAAQLERA